MYYYISGDLVLAEPGTAVIDAGGVGYRLSITTTTLGKLAASSGKVKLYTHLAIKEDSHELFGFYTEDELAAFRMLISVSGVGAKSAIAILSLMTHDRLAAAITSGDAKSLSKAPGIGGKTAARIILELKDKVARELSSTDNDISETGDSVTGDKYEEAQRAMMVLGYSRSEAAYALRDIKSADMTVEDLIREALKRLMK